jgi:2-C-methyl-D-erythritol 2,4-cyclodiphosphate synthase
MNIRIGQGFDVHALVSGRKLVIGGVEIPSPRGLLGHSDARFKNADSRSLLHDAVARAKDAGWRIGNIDATVIAEQPKIAPHVSAMCAAIAIECGVDAGAVNVKGKTSEKLGFAGRGEGIAALAVVLLFRDKP